jgi:hypothetical protein
VVAKPVNTVSSEPKRRGRVVVRVVSSCSRIVLVRVLGCLNVVSKPTLHKYKCCVGEIWN